MYSYYYMYNNPYYLIGMGLVMIGVVLMLIAQAKVKSSYSKYSKVANSRGSTGYQIARDMLDNNGLRDVSINMVKGTMTDFYNPKDRSVNLSTKVYNDATIASLAIAAHECGHAIQHNEGYQPLVFRNTILPVCNIGQTVGWIAVIIGLLFSNLSIAWFGVLAMSGILLFQVVTLPVEFDASARALEILKTRYLTTDEYGGAKKVLSAAALTYVAAMLATLMSLLRIALLVVGSNRD
ncbi:zinc metallopeptidase [Tannockella kyphosi]|uniref:zinc metallopeptidase n=1 Tax=Tannockella kyphosi TaxID=2899121 RepID=UPI002011F3AF|nr:zinc metallopeptidase [Tannockella kyphosi]